MKAAPLFITASALAALGRSAPAPVNTDSGTVLPTSAAVFDGYSEDRNAEADAAALQVAAFLPHASASLNARGDVTSTPDVAGNPPNNPVIFRIEMGNVKQHVGAKTGDELALAIHQCIDQLCPSGQSDCEHIKGCDIEPIYYNYKGHRAANAKLTVVVERSWFPPGYPGLREAIIDTLCGTYSAMSRDLKNCHFETLDGQQEEFCNINEYVNVELAHWHGANDELKDPGAHLWTSVTFNGISNEGQFDCVGSETPVINKLHDDRNLVDKIATIIGEPRNSIKESIECPKKEVTRDVALAPPSSLHKRTTNTAYIGIGSQRQHVGILEGQGMWDKVYQCLESLCPPSQSGFNICDEKSYCRISNIAYNAKGKYSDEAFLKVKVKLHYLPDNHYGMREALFQQIAGTFKVFTEDARNCYDVELDPKGRVQMCNVPEVVFVHVDFLAWFYVTLEFNGPTTEGPLDCSNTIPAVEDFFKGNAQAAMAHAIGIQNADLGVNTGCESAK